MNEKELEEKINFLSSARCNHTQHMYIDITGDLVQGTLLARILYWFAPGKNGESKLRIFKDGYFWIAKQRKDWWKEIRITERQYDKAIKELKEKGFIVLAKYKFNSMPTIHIRPEYENINSATEKWKNDLKKEIIEEYEQELQKSKDGNNTKCNSYRNYTKCKTGVTQTSNLLTGITNTNYYNIDYNTDITEKGDTTNKFVGEVDTSVSEQKPTAKSNKRTYSELKELETDMLKRVVKICDTNLGFSQSKTKEVLELFEYYFHKYTQKTGKIHPILTDSTLKRIINELIAEREDGENHKHFSGILEYEGVAEAMIDTFFEKGLGEGTDYHISHFATNGVLLNLGCRANLGEI